MRTERILRTLRTWSIATAIAVLQAGTPAHAADDYRLGAGDLLHISVYGSPDLTGDVRVSESGAITCPLIGSVPVAKLSTDQVEAALAERYVQGGFLRQPQISVLVTEYRSQQVAVLGLVAKPGQYALRSSTSTVLDMLAEAGGLVPESAGDRATLVRADGKRVELNLDALLQGDPQQNPRLAGGDRLFVPRAQQFYIYGQVQKPGVYRLEHDMTVSRAITVGGGLTPRGSERRVVVKRRAQDGSEKRKSIKPSDVLQADDVLYIKESLF
ncbi:MAG TPA: polysaccharide biosynthesis/export family protein [Steroidobacteraceae bacterium]|nr:polysaccharide biosynthesis/export family protein [Steroidobacteraceae bacterium]